VSAGEIIEYCRDKVPPYARPKFVEFRDDLPLTVTEKLFKRALREEEIQKMKERGELE
jgi:long-chain acyl-CoA synthetase